jgi:transcriptional adapter 2-alpha
VSLLLPEEKELCSAIRVYPKPYLVMKDLLLREYATQGKLKLSQAQDLLKIDPDKTRRIFEFFCESGWIKTMFRSA